MPAEEAGDALAAGTCLDHAEGSGLSPEYLKGAPQLSAR